MNYVTNKFRMELPCKDGHTVVYVWPSTTAGDNHIDVFKPAVRKTIMGFIPVYLSDVVLPSIEELHPRIAEDATQSYLGYYAVDEDMNDASYPHPKDVLSIRLKLVECPHLERQYELEREEHTNSQFWHPHPRGGQELLRSARLILRAAVEGTREDWEDIIRLIQSGKEGRSYAKRCEFKAQRMDGEMVYAVSCPKSCTKPVYIDQESAHYILRSIPW